MFYVALVMLVLNGYTVLQAASLPAGKQGTAVIADTKKETHLFDAARFQEQPEATATHLTAGHKKGQKEAGIISAYTFNIEDPWIANLILHEEFAYTSDRAELADCVQMNASGNRVLLQLSPPSAHISAECNYMLFERQNNGRWSKIARFSGKMTGNTFVTNGEMNQIAIRTNDNLFVINYNVDTNKLKMKEIADIKFGYFSFISMNSAGTIIALGNGTASSSTGSIDLFYRDKGLWKKMATSLVDKATSMAMSRSGRHIIAGLKNELIIFECPQQGEPVCKQVQKLSTLEDIKAVAISGNGKHIGIKVCDSSDYTNCQCLIYKQKDSNENETLWEKVDTIDLHRMPYPFGVIDFFMAINNDGNRIAESTREKAYFYFKLGNSWRSLLIPNLSVELAEKKEGNDPRKRIFRPANLMHLAMNSAGDRIAVAEMYGTMRILSFRPEVLELNVVQLNFIRDLYEQDKKIKESNNPHAWITLSSKDVKIFKTMPKSIQLALRTLYKLTTQESIDAAQQKLKEKNKDQKTAAATVSTSTPITPPTWQATSKNAPIDMEAVD